MLQTAPVSGPVFALDVDQLNGLILHLSQAGYEVIGPRVEDGTAAYGPVRNVDELAKGWTDAQGPGEHNTRQEGEAYFGFHPGPEGFERYRYPPRERLTHLGVEGGRLRVLDDEVAPPQVALLGMRPCDVAAMQIQDRVFATDSRYQARRARLFTVAVACTRPGGTCFCTSMGTGPGLGDGYDLGLTELEDREPRFVLEVGSERGQAVANALELPIAPSEAVAAAHRAVGRAEAQVERSLPGDDLPGLLRAVPDHPQWEDVGNRCLACGNCTMVCPTCFCGTVEDHVDVSGTLATRERRWDSCFSAAHSSLHGGPVRHSVSSRYRQWLTHKLDYWHDQFGRSGCVGCGRCITWCPVGIDLTQEVAAIRGEAEASPHGR